jgi:transcriptional accessory protein Tex/SPT6
MVELFDAGGTVPFVVRYRSYCTGQLSPAQVFAFYRSYVAFTAMVKSRDTKMEKLRSTGKLSHDLLRRFELCLNTAELEDLWAPFKQSRENKATRLMSVPGMSPLVRGILDGTVTHFNAIGLPAGTKENFQDAVVHLLADHFAHKPENVHMSQQVFDTRCMSVTVTWSEQLRSDRNECVNRSASTLKSHQVDS